MKILVAVLFLIVGQILAWMMSPIEGYWFIIPGAISGSIAGILIAQYFIEQR